MNIPGWTAEASLVVPNDSFVQNYSNPKTKSQLTCGSTIINQNTYTPPDYEITTRDTSYASLVQANNSLHTPDAGKTTFAWNLGGHTTCPSVTVNINTLMPEWA